LVQIGGLVERPVIRHRQRLGKFNKLPGSLDVGAMMFRQDAQYDAVHSRFFGLGDRAPHL